jgi:hypothetical protein
MSGYIGSTPVPQATQHRESFTCTEGQTTFNTAGYTAQFVDVYLNGSHLSPVDFTATNGSDVVLAVAASADDVCDIISYTPFEIADQTFTGTTTLDGAVVINESSADVDFRVESNGNANALFVDGETDNVMIGTSVAGRATEGADRLTIADASHSGMTIRSGVNAYGSINFSDSEGGVGEYAGQIWFGHGSLGNKLVLASGGTNKVIVDSTGAVTIPLQPAFGVHPATTQSDIAINGIRTVVFGTERFDIGSNFASNTFTAPVTGKYQLNVEIRLDNVDTAATYYHLYLTTSNKTYHNIIQPLFTSDPAYMSLCTAALADMDEDDTAYVGIYQAAGTAQTDIHPDSNFTGILVA